MYQRRQTLGAIDARGIRSQQRSMHGGTETGRNRSTSRDRSAFANAYNSHHGPTATNSGSSSSAHRNHRLSLGNISSLQQRHAAASSSSSSATTTNKNVSNLSSDFSSMHLQENQNVSANRQSLGRTAIPTSTHRRKTDFGGLPSASTYNGSSSSNSNSGSGPVHHAAQAAAMFTQAPAAPKGMKDPRHIRDKQWQQKSIRTIIAFLASTGYDRSDYSAARLQQMSQKDFHSLFQFIYAMYDPGHQFKEKNSEEEVHFLVRAMRYPFPESITKHVLMTAGSVTSLPHIIGLLIWMVELVVCVRHLNQRSEESRDPKDMTATHRLFADWVLQSYGKFFYNGIDDEEELKDAIKELFRAKDAATLEECRALQEANDALESKIAELTAQGSQLPQLKADIEQVQKDKAWYRDVIDTKKQKGEANVEKMAALDTEVRQRDARIQTLLADIAAIEKQVANQEMSPAEVERINSELDELRRISEQVKTRKEEVRQDVYEKELALHRSLDDLEEGIRKFNKVTEKIGLVPRSAPNSDGHDFMLRIDLNTAQENSVLNLDLNGLFKDRLGALNGATVQSTYKAQEKLVGLQEKLARLKEHLTDKDTEIQNTKRRHQTLLTQYEDERKMFQSQEQAGIEEAEALESKINRVRMETSKTLTESESQLHRAKKEYEEWLHTAEKARDKAKNDLLQIMEEIADFKMTTHAIVTPTLQMATDAVAESSARLETFRKEAAALGLTLPAQLIQKHEAADQLLTERAQQRTAKRKAVSLPLSASSSSPPFTQEA